MASLLFIFIFLISCRSTSQQNRVNKICFYRNIPLVSTQDGVLQNVFDSAAIYNYNDYILYEQPALYTKFYNNKLIKDTVYNQYFIFSKKDSFGYWFDSLTAKKEFNIMSLDSFYFTHSFLNDMKLYQKNNDRKLSSDTLKNGIEVVETYIPKAKIDDSYPDTSIFYFSENLKNIPYSFSKELDSIKQSKIYRTQLIYNEMKSNKYALTIPRREFLFEFKEAEAFDEKKIIEFINRYQKIQQNLK